MSKRWLVERKGGEIEDFGYESMTVEPSGALRFWDGSIFEPKNRSWIAPGEWVTVLEEEDA